MNIKSELNLNIGQVSITTLLMALLLVTLALFSILTANMHNLFLGKAIQHNSEYIEADRVAQQLIAEIDKSLVTGAPLPIECWQSEGIIEFSVEVRANTAIYVRLRILENDERRYTIEWYSLVNSLEWQPATNNTPIWTGA